MERRHPISLEMAATETSVVRYLLGRIHEEKKMTDEATIMPR